MRREIAARPRTWLRQLTGFVRKELIEVVHQPRLIGLLVLGPFVILLLFGAGYRNERLVLKALFVAPSEGLVADSLSRYQDQVGEFMEVEGLTSDVLDARQRLVDDEVDVLVIFPPDPMERLMRNERVPISVIHDKLDPIQQVAIDFAVRLAVDEVNAAVLASAVREGQEAVPVGTLMAALRTASDAANREAASGGTAGSGSAVQELGTRWATLRDAVRFAVEATGSISDDDADGGDDRAADLQELVDEIDAELRPAQSGATGQIDLARVAVLVDELERRIQLVASIDPEVLVRPFVGETFTATPQDVELLDFYAPAAVVLLLQHLGLTLGSLSLVRDRALGLFEIYRIGPVSVTQTLGGKFMSYVVIGGLVAAALVLLIVAGLGVPLAGDVAWLVVMLGLVLSAAVSLGLLVSMIAPTDAQAVQYGMIVLLASLFLGGFFLDIERLSYPVKAISMLLPLTYGIRGVQDVMLRGIEPDWTDLAGLVALTLVYSALATMRFRRTMRVV